MPLSMLLGEPVLLRNRNRLLGFLGQSPEVWPPFRKGPWVLVTGAFSSSGKKRKERSFHGWEPITALEDTIFLENRVSRFL